MFPSIRTILFTGVAMMAFAANSIFCRLALGQGQIDAASFTSVRMISGAVILWIIVKVRATPAPQKTPLRVQIVPALMLFFYMTFFSFAYLSLNTGTGALILFGAVQLTMFGAALKKGETFSAMSWVGLTCASGGLIYLLLPGVSAPDPLGALLMVVSGMAWGVYSLLGKKATNPLLATATNFKISIPLVIMVSLLFFHDIETTTYGVILAVASGALASGCGYVIWYKVLPKLNTTHAATVQLSVPMIAAFGGIVVLSEDLTIRLILASIATLGGVAMVLSQRGKA